jgi:hypothetical protein
LRDGRDEVVIESMLKQDSEVGERGFELMVTGGLEGFILGVRGTGNVRG